ncbi:MAG: NAD(P)-dependent glycerol-3-phosphate dehydrogenase [Chitinispirillaceae bacterium]|nr:NAD(P)-dependent glycerol-3-phosphate dehydrogenase [Chitinispirillaceae bacterium]
MNIAILGAGSWAIALAVLLHRRKHVVSLWEYDAVDAQSLDRTRELPRKLPGIKVPSDILVTNDIAHAVRAAGIVVCAVPSQTMRPTMKQLAASVSRSDLDSVQGFVIVAKGIETGTLKLMSDVVVEQLPGVAGDRVAVLSGPSHAEEVSRNIPTTVVAASQNNDLAVLVQELFATETFRIYTNPDMRGVELSGSVKNVIAIAAGMCDGLGFGDNTKGALLTRGIAEMMRLGRKLGAQPSTFSGLAGIGDLITTCISRHSRNRKMGELIASGLSLQQALGQMTMVAEGVETTRSVHQLACKLGIEMPITQEVYNTLFEGKDARISARDLMNRESKPEWW